MARPLRIQYDGAVYHITSRGNAKKLIYSDDADRWSFLDILHKVNKRDNWLCHAYCLMNNHYHLIIETPDGNLSKGMRQLNGVYTQWFNKVHDNSGHILQGRYKAILIQKESHLLETCRYVVLNPVRAGSVQYPEQWKWSSYNAMLGKSKPHTCLTTGWVLGQFGKSKKEAERRYREFVHAGIGEESLHNKVTGQSILGEEDFIDKLNRYIREHEGIKEITKEQRYMNRPMLKIIFNEMVLASRKKRNGKIREAIEKHGYSQKEVANHLGMHYASISRLIKS